MIGSARSLQHIIPCIIYTGLLIFISMQLCNGMPVDISVERLNEGFLPPESSEKTEAFDPLEINDGQSLDAKLKIMKLLSELEKEMEEKFRRRKNHTKINATATPIKAAPYIFEGDIILQPEQALEIVERGKRRQKRKLHAKKVYLWKLPIWYTFHPNEYNKMEENSILESIIILEKLTCIKFKKIDYHLLLNSTFQLANQNNVTINFTKDMGLVLNSKTNPVKVLSWINSLDGKFVWDLLRSHPGCEMEIWMTPYKHVKTNLEKINPYIHLEVHVQNEGSLLHELGHVIGFWHEHSRPDRDSHINVENDSIEEGKLFNFYKSSWQNVETKNVSYDVSSIMHYSATAFAAVQGGGTFVKPTLIARDVRLQRALGQRQEFSFYDAKLANLAYCQDVCDPSLLAKTCLHDGYQDPKNCSRCRCADGLGGDYCENVQIHPQSTVKSGEIFVSDKPIMISAYTTSDYRKGTKLSWLFKTEPNKNIKLTFKGDFMMYYNCTDDPNEKCRDYVEVRYYHNLANPGARFCCFNKNDKTPPLLSEGNQMLVLMRAFGDGKKGFEAEVVSEYCGGYGQNSRRDQSYMPCSRLIKETCQQVWEEREEVSCKTWYTWAPDCKTEVMVKKSRPALCPRSTYYCSDGFFFDGQLCVGLTSTFTLPPSQTTHTVTFQDNKLSSTSNVLYDAVGWTIWSSWSACSATCGGCGIQTRDRTCEDSQLCGGKTYEREAKQCGLQPCDKDKVSNKCTREIEKQKLCSPLSMDICVTTYTETYDCFGTCCANYKIDGNSCVPINKR